MIDKDQAYLMHILESIDKAGEHLAVVEKLGFKRWDQHPTTRDSMLYTLQTMAESCKLLSDITKARMPEIPWKQIAGFRNVIAHDYLGDIDDEKVDSIIETQLPQLK